jgi:predicted RNase H-like nuclease
MRRNDKLLHKLFTHYLAGPNVADATHGIADNGVPIHEMAARDASVFFGSLGTPASPL